MLTTEPQVFLFLAISSLIVTAAVIWFTGTTGGKTTSAEIVNNARVEQKKQPEKNYPQYLEAYGYLWKYIEGNLGQGKSIFRLTVVIIFAGFVMIAYGIVDARSNTLSLLSSHAWPSVVAGIITEFIAATILFVYRSISRQTDNYFQTLVRLTAIGSAIRILDDITDTISTKSKTIDTEIPEDRTTELTGNTEWINHTKAEFAKLLLELQHSKSNLERPSENQMQHSQEAK